MTRKQFDQLLSTQRDDLASAIINGQKGFYRKTLGPTASFRGFRTWKQAAIELELIEVE